MTETAETESGGERGHGDPGTAGGRGCCELRTARGPGEAYARASLALADLVAAHDFDLRQWRVLDFIRRQSVGAGRLEAYIPRLDLFVVATRISRGNLSAILAGLKRAWVIEERPQWCYGFRFPIENWKVPVRLEEVEVIRQLELLEAPEHLRDALRQNFVEQMRMGKPGGAPGSSTTVSNAALAGRTRPPGDALPLRLQLERREDGVPESGTQVHAEGQDAGRTRIGYEGQSPGPPGGCGGVPESGTGHVTMSLQQCSSVSSKKHFCNVTYVPESGTGDGQEGVGRARAAVRRAGGMVPTGELRAGTARGPGALDSERQRLFDELGKAGAFGVNNGSRWCWLGMVRQRPAVVAELLGELRYARTQQLVENPGGWMMDKWQRWGRPDR